MSGNESTNLKNAANMDTPTSIFFCLKLKSNGKLGCIFKSQAYFHRFINRLSNDFVAKKNYSKQKKKQLSNGLNVYFDSKVFYPKVF